MTYQFVRAFWIGLLIFCLNSQVVLAAPQIITHGKIALAISEERGNVNIRIKADPQIHESVLTLENPARVVLDLAGVRAGGNHTEAVKDIAMISAVRIGVHPDHARLVFDINSPAPPPYLVSRDSKEITLTLQGDPVGTSKPAAAPSPTPLTIKAQVSAAPTAAIRVTVHPTTTPIPSPTTLNTPTAAPTATAAAAQSDPKQIEPKQDDQKKSAALNQPPAEAAEQQLTAIEFQTGNPPTERKVALNLVHHAEFSLNRVSDHEYRIFVPQCALAGEHLAKPFFPPQEFEGFTMIHAVAQPEGLAITFGVDRGVRITAVAADNHIIVRAVGHS